MTNSTTFPYLLENEDIKGKRIIVGGGTTGIGRATALLLVSNGAKVLIFGRHSQELSDALKDIEKHGEIYGLVADQSRHSEVLDVFERADGLLGPIDVLINNASVGTRSITDTGYEKWHYDMAANICGYIDCSQQAVFRMAKHGRGHIINIGSLSAELKEGGDDLYVAAKSAVQGFTDSLRKTVNKIGIKVTLIEPGSVGTNMVKQSSRIQRELERKYKMLRAEDIASCVLYSLTQPTRSDIIKIQVKPGLQII